MATKKTRRRTTSGTRRTASTRRRTARTGTTRRRARPGLPTTVGAALGTLAVTTLLDLSWPARIGLLVLVGLAGLGYVVWRHRAEVSAAAQAPAGPADPDATPPTTPPTAPSS